MKKFLKRILLLSLVILMLPSCTLGVPSWLVRNTSFDLDEEVMNEIIEFVETIKTDTAYFERQIGNVAEYFYTDTKECLFYKENSLDTIEAFRSGKLYNYDYDTDRLIRKDYKFNSSEYETEIEKGYEILKSVLGFSSDCYDVSSYKVTGERNNINVSIGFNKPELSSASAMLDVKFVDFGFVYNSKEKTYSKPFVNWQTKDVSYSLSFDEADKGVLNKMISGLFEK